MYRGMYRVCTGGMYRVCTGGIYRGMYRGVYTLAYRVACVLFRALGNRSCHLQVKTRGYIIVIFSHHKMS